MSWFALPNALLFSNATQYGGNYMSAIETPLVDALGVMKTIVFVPYAREDWKEYSLTVCTRLRQSGLAIQEIDDEQPSRSIAKADAVLIGGGNTFRLLYHLHARRVIPCLRDAVLHGLRYVGVSAGAVVAGPTLCTTNSMPIMMPVSYDALGIVPFQINAHYFEQPEDVRIMGESRDQRIGEYIRHAGRAVVALREGCYLDVAGQSVTVKGNAGAVLFRSDGQRYEYAVGAKLPSDDLIARA